MVSGPYPQYNENGGYYSERDSQPYHQTFAERLLHDDHVKNIVARSLGRFGCKSKCLEGGDFEL